MGDCAISESEIGFCLRFTKSFNRGPTGGGGFGLFTGTGRRRHFSEDFKAGIVEETLVPGAVVSEVARRHGLTPQQVFTWRRQARQPITSEAEAPKFVPAIVEPAVPARPSRGRPRKWTRQMGGSAGSIE